jgi:hypothetical protein
METRNHLIDGRDDGYLDDNLYFRLMNLAGAALRATTNLMRSKQRQAAAAEPSSANRRNRSNEPG